MNRKLELALKLKTDLSYIYGKDSFLRKTADELYHLISLEVARKVKRDRKEDEIDPLQPENTREE